MTTIYIGLGIKDHVLCILIFVSACNTTVLLVSLKNPELLDRQFLILYTCVHLINIVKESLSNC